jgi:hypothetical protein
VGRASLSEANLFLFKYFSFFFNSICQLLISRAFSY